MAIYHLNLSRGTKGNGKYGGKSALAKFNYIIRDDKYIKGKEEILATNYGYLPNFAKDNPATFWEATDNYEANNGILFRQLEVALPRELNAEQQQELCQQFAEAVCGKYQLPYTYAIHRGEFDHRGNKTKAEPTPHFHLIFSERANDETERKKRTAKNYFQRKGGAKKVRELQAKEWLISHRKLWADLANQALEKAGFSERIDHRSLLEQGITDREPQKKKHWRDNQSQIMPSIYETVRELRKDKNKFDNLQIEINKKLLNLEIETKKQEEEEARKKAELEAKRKAEEEAKAKAEDKKLADMFAGFYSELDNKAEREAEKAEEEAKARAEAERARIEAEARRKAELEAKRKAEEELNSAKNKSYQDIRQTYIDLFGVESISHEEMLDYFKQVKTDIDITKNKEELEKETKNYIDLFNKVKQQEEEELKLAKNKSYQDIRQKLTDLGGIDILSNTIWLNYLKQVKTDIDITKNKYELEEKTKKHIKALNERASFIQPRRQTTEQTNMFNVVATPTYQAPQPQQPSLLPDFSYTKNPRFVGQKVFEIIGGKEELGQMPDFRKLPQAIKELEEQGFTVDKKSLNRAVEQAKRGEIDAIDLVYAFADSISPQSRDYVKTKDYVR